MRSYRRTQLKLFIHIPKTAGTSLRTAAEARFGKARVLSDYGPASKETSESIRSTVFESGNPENIQKTPAYLRANLIAGHVELAKYGRLVGLPNTTAFFREPVAQVISHYRHAFRHNGFEGTLLEFARLPELQNLQTRYINGIDPALIGVVGLTESYKSSLDLLKKRWGWNLPHRKRNVNNRFGLKREDEFRQDRTEIEQLNQVDMLTYKRAKQVHTDCLRSLEISPKRDVRGGFCKAMTRDEIKGWACDLLSESPIEIEILVDSKPLCRVRPDLPLNELANWKLPRNGQFGFRIPDTNLPPGSEVEMIDPLHRITLDTRKLD